jgi:hypothetical protein
MLRQDFIYSWHHQAVARQAVCKNPDCIIDSERVPDIKCKMARNPIVIGTETIKELVTRNTMILGMCASE